jgi:electron transfer flavoprotein alpha subunit
MQNAATIISINTDSQAPIFNLAHYAVVGDLYQVVPSLLNRIRKGGTLI